MKNKVVLFAFGVLVVTGITISAYLYKTSASRVKTNDVSHIKYNSSSEKVDDESVPSVDENKLEFIVEDENNEYGYSIDFSDYSSSDEPLEPEEPSGDYGYSVEEANDYSSSEENE